MLGNSSPGISVEWDKFRQRSPQAAIRTPHSGSKSDVHTAMMGRDANGEERLLEN